MLLYRLLLLIAFPWIMVHLVVRGFRNRDYWHRWPERFGYIVPLESAERIWIHAVSVGETRAAALLVPVLMKRYPRHRILITTMTPTGSAQVRDLFGNTVEHCYLPYDYPSAVRRFMDRAQPDIGIIMETELWPNLFGACRARAMPLLVSNVRMSEKSMHGYLRFPVLAASTLAKVDRLAVQSEADGERMRRLGASSAQIEITGSIKFEIDIAASLREAAEVTRREWGGTRLVWIAASTREGEEEKVLAVYQQLRERHPELLLVLVPRHPERCAQVGRLIRRMGLAYVARSTHRGAIAPETDILLGDTMGELVMFFGAADIAYIGGSLVPTGGHNLLEAAALGRPVVIGPHTFNFVEITRLAVARGAARQVADEGGLLGAMEALIDNPELRTRMGEAGLHLVEENRGALNKNLAIIESLLAPPGARAGA